MFKNLLNCVNCIVKGVKDSWLNFKVFIMDKVLKMKTTKSKLIKLDKNKLFDLELLFDGFINKLDNELSNADIRNQYIILDTFKDVYIKKIDHELNIEIPNLIKELDIDEDLNQYAYANSIVYLNDLKVQFEQICKDVENEKYGEIKPVVVIPEDSETIEKSENGFKKWDKEFKVEVIKNAEDVLNNLSSEDSKC